MNADAKQQSAYAFNPMISPSKGSSSKSRLNSAYFQAKSRSIIGSKCEDSFLANTFKEIAYEKIGPTSIPVIDQYFSQINRKDEVERTIFINEF